jgi:hypothetical protein
MRIRIHGNVSANQKPAKNTRLSIPCVLNRPVASGTCVPSRCPGNVFTELFPRELAFYPVRSEQTCCPGNVCTEPLPRERVYRVVATGTWLAGPPYITLLFSFGRFWGWCLATTISGCCILLVAGWMLARGVRKPARARPRISASILIT